MKTLIGLTVLSLMSFTAFAGDITFTTAEFRIVKVAPLCPRPAPGEVSCTALGGKVTVVATLGCLDKLLFSHFEVIEGIVPTIRAVSVVRADSDSSRVMCTQMNSVKKTVTVSTINGSQVELVNEEIR